MGKVEERTLPILDRWDPPLRPARLIRRYKRFLADVEMDGQADPVTVHCPNPGAMTGCAEPGMRVLLAPVANPKAKLPWRWVLSETVEGVMIGIDTTRANRIAAALLARRAIPELAEWPEWRAEVVYDDGNSRVDFLLTDPRTRCPPLYLEVKSVTLRRDDRLQFPDAPTRRGTRHLRALARIAAGGEARAAVLYLAQRDDGACFSLARDIDPAYALAHEEAARAGVMTLARQLRLTQTAVHDAGPLPLEEA
ncbi:MAG: DNA/RNA nuclease SfsA [Alphaproteobacteria bacterium]|nr:MAG: DNA/RNA nuclease SfsA [Alphaproteobacteria bacterium]